MPIPRPHPTGDAPARVRRGLPSAVAPTLVLILGLALAGCRLPTGTEEPPTADPSEAPIGSATPDPAAAAVAAEVDRLGATVGAARQALTAALEADGLTGARAAAEDALALLVADPDATPEQDPRPLFPGETLERGDTTDAPDQLTHTLTAARDDGGTLGSRVIDLLRDPVAGDLGAWQRDAAGVVASVSATTEEADDLAGLEAAIGELPGLGTQAIAWAQLVTDADDLDAARAYAERGVASLDVVIVSLEALDEPTDGGDA